MSEGLRSVQSQQERRVALRLPATSANLGPAFDTAAVALDLHLEVIARPAAAWGITARGRDAAACERLDCNLIVDTYRRVLEENGRPVELLHFDINNEIPLGMGCGSSAAARLAGIALAVEFGGLKFSEDDILSLATALEGHPDNVTACWLGGMTVSAVEKTGGCSLAPQVHVARIPVPAYWRAVVLFPRDPVRTEESRKVLPTHYSRADVVENLQRCSLLVAAFASGRGELLRAAMTDRLHQPYRSAICPLLDQLEYISQVPGVLGAALSGAGPGMLLIADLEAGEQRLASALAKLLLHAPEVDILQCGFQNRGANATFEAAETLNSLAEK